MDKFYSISRLLSVCLLFIQAGNVCSSEQALNTEISARAGYYDNLFLVEGSSEGVSSLTITPSLTGLIRDENWETRLSARLNLNKYSGETLDSNDQFFSLSGNYQSQRNIFSLSIGHSLVSNLNSATEDIGIARKQIERKTQTVSPSYTRLLTERASLSVSLTYSDVGFLNSESTSFTPYVTQSGSVSLQYRLSLLGSVSFTFQTIDYESKDQQVTYLLFISNVGVVHSFSETLSINFQIGVSRQNTTSQLTQIIDFFGNTIEARQEIDAENRGLVLNAGVTKSLETGSVNGTISRNNTTNSFGGLDETDSIVFSYEDKLSTIWSYDISSSFSSITSISSGSSTIDRDIFTLQIESRYSLAHNWSAKASYRYLLRRFKSDTSNDRAPHSNAIFIGVSYNFPPISTF